MLCWVHEGRHTKKLCPWLPERRKVLGEFLKEFWAYYRELAAYRQWLTDRVREANEMPSLAEVIEERAARLHLGASWHRS